MKSLLIKTLLEGVNLLFHNAVFHALCRRSGRVGSVFCVYPATARYADYFSFPFRRRKILWTPYLIGMARQKSSWTLVYGISAIESEILDPTQRDNLLQLNLRLQSIANATGARSIHYAGIVPSVMKQRDIPRDNVEQRVTVDAVLKAVRLIDPERRIGTLVLLGARGYIGACVMEKLQGSYTLIGVEKGERYTAPQVPHIVLNISAPGALRTHLESFNPHTVLINEVYPAPHRALLQEIKARGAHVHHIAGIRAAMFPSLPGDYQGAMPCCGGMENTDNEVVLRRL